MLKRLHEPGKPAARGQSIADPHAGSEPPQAMVRPKRNMTVDDERRLSPSLVGLLDRGFI